LVNKKNPQSLRGLQGFEKSNKGLSDRHIIFVKRYPSSISAVTLPGDRNEVSATLWAKS